MQLSNLIKPLDKMPDDELLEKLRAVRHNREIARPVARRRAANVAKKESRARSGRIEKLLVGLSEEERNALIEQLSQGGEDE